MFIDNTPYQTLEFAPPVSIPIPGVDPIYQEATVYEIDNGAQQNIIAICDDSWVEMGLSGLPFSEQQAPVPHEVGDWPQGIGMPAGPLPAFVLAKASGGSYFGTQNVAGPSPHTLVFGLGGLLGPNPNGMIILPDPKNPQVSVLIDNVPLYP
jgi:hypothetical protein